MLPALLKAGADVNAVANFDKTALMSLSLTNQYRAVEMLLNAGADWKIQSKSGLSLCSIIRISDGTWDETNIEYSAFLRVKKRIHCDS
jgi:ankyrin repeat protein